MLHSSPPTPRAAPGPLADLAAGAALPLRAAWLTLTRPRLLGLALVCAAVTGACLVALAYFLWEPASRLAHGWVGAGSGMREALGTGLAVLLYLALLAASALTVPAVLLAPLQDPLSEATEELLGGFSAPPFTLGRAVAGIRLSLAHTALRLVLQLLGYAVLLPLNLIPAAGSVLWAVLSGLWTMWWLSAEYLSGPMARHFHPFRRVLKAMRARPGLALGFGAALHLLLIVPAVNFFLVPVAVVGSTLYFRRLAAQGNIAPEDGVSFN